MPIVTINVSQQVAPSPLTLQSTGAIISQGATNLAQNSYALLTSAAALTSLLAAPLALSGLSWSGGVVTATTAAGIPGGWNVGTVFSATIAGASPTGYNGTFAATITSGNTFTYALASNPGTALSFGTYTPPTYQGLINKVNTFFGQGSSQAVYVLELGVGNAASGPTALQTFIGNNPATFYSYLVPGQWDGSAQFLSLLAAFEALNAKTYFFITTTVSTYTSYTALMKCLYAMVQAPNAPVTEDSVAAAFQHSLSYAPSSTNRMTPFANAYLFGVTPYPQLGNQTLLATLAAANINYVGTGAEGGISTAIVTPGKMLDGNDFTYWYSVDWAQLTSQQVIANAIINGSNNPANPLYYNQPGINVLQDLLVQNAQSGVAFGLANGTVTQTALDGPVFQENLDDGDYVDQIIVNAVPFLIYTAENTGDYKIGRYAGFTMVWIPQRGFAQIVFNILVSQFLSV